MAQNIKYVLDANQEQMFPITVSDAVQIDDRTTLAEVLSKQEQINNNVSTALGKTVRTDEQTLTEEQKAQVRDNIGAVDANANVASANIANNLSPEDSDSVIDEAVSFIGRTTAGNTSIPEVGVTKIESIQGNVGEDGETCFNPTYGFLSTTNNWFIPSLTRSGYKLDAQGNVVADAQYTLVFVPTIPAESGVGKNNGFLIYFGEGATDTTIGVVGYRSQIPAAGNSCTILTPTTRGGIANTYGATALGWMIISVKSTDKLCIHPAWSGNWNTIYYEPTVSAVIGIPVCDHGLGDLDQVVRTTNTSCRLIQNQNQVVLKNLTWSVESSDNEGTITYTFTASLPNDAKNNPTIRHSNEVQVSVSGTTLTITSTTISTVSALKTYLGNHTILYELAESIITDYDMALSVANSDLGGEFFMASSTTLVQVAPSAITLLYGSDLKALLRDLLKQEPLFEKVAAASDNLLYNMLNSMVENILTGEIEKLRVRELTVAGKMISIGTTVDILFPDINEELKSITVAPETAQIGDRYYNSTDKKIYTYDGTAWGQGVNPFTVVYYKFENAYYKSVSNVLTAADVLAPLWTPTRFSFFIDNISATRHIWMATGTSSVSDYIQLV